MVTDQAKRRKQPSKNGEMSTWFFKGGKEEVRQLLVNAVRKARQRKKITRRKLDEMCSLKEDGLPSCREFEKTPSRMTQVVFCRVACALDLRIDDVLRLEVAGDKLDAVVSQMKKEKAGLAAALRLGESRDIPDDAVAPVYAAIRVLSEI